MEPKDWLSKGVEHRPWEPMGMTTAEWKKISPISIPLNKLVATQKHSYDISEAQPSWSGDNIIHVVNWQGVLFVNDGHHRVMRALARGDDSILARLCVRKYPAAIA